MTLDHKLKEPEKEQEDALDHYTAEMGSGMRGATDECWRRARACAPEDVATRRRVVSAFESEANGVGDEI